MKSTDRPSTLYLMRHGLAARRPDGPPDAERPLTSKGVRRTRRAGRGLKALGVAPEALVSSPLLRAVQTAEIVAAELGLDKDRIRKSKALGPEEDPEKALGEVKAIEAAAVLVVGHSPHLDRMLSRSLGAGNATVGVLKKAGAACVEFASGSADGKLLWLLEPKTLRRLGGGKAPKKPPKRG